jgi:lipopolysaccharide exporter
LALVAHDLVVVALGEKWLIAVPFLQALSIGYLVGILGPSRVAVLVAMGEVRLLTMQSGLLTLVRAVIIVISAWLFGAVGVAWGVVASAGVVGTVILIWQSREGYLDLADLWRQTRRPLASVIVMAIAVEAASMSIGPDMQVWQGLLLKIGVGAIVYTVSLLTMWYVFGRPAGPEDYLLRFVRGFRRPGYSTG